MKKFIYLSLIFGAMISLSSCQNEEEDLFGASAAERLNQMKAEYAESLWRSPNGWAMQYYPTYQNEDPYGRGYLILCDFNEDYSVRVAMNTRSEDGKGNITYNYVEDSSAWEILTDNGPVLSFNTFNKVMHTFSNPEDIQSTTESETGRGYEGDYEFIITQAPSNDNFMMLKGKKRGTYSLLTTLDEGVDYKEYLDEVIRFQDKMFSKNAPTFNVVHFGENLYKMEDANDGIPNIYPYDGDKILDESFNPFLITKRGNDFYLRFRDAFSLGSDVKVQDFRYDTEHDVFVSVDNASYYIGGDSPIRFFEQTMNSTTVGGWAFTQTSPMSDDLKAIIDNIAAEMKTKKATFNEVSFVRDGENFALRINYKAPSNANCFYNFTRQIDGDNMTLTYTGAKNTQAEKLIANVAPSIQSLLDLFNGATFVVTSGETDFDLTKIKLTNGDTWVITNYTGTTTNGGEEA